MHHGPQLLIEKQVGLLPVDARMRGGKVKMHEVGEISLDGFFPGTVVVVRHGTLRLLQMRAG